MESQDQSINETSSEADDKNHLINNSFLPPLHVPSQDFAQVHFSAATTNSSSLTFSSTTEFSSLPSLSTSHSFDGLQNTIHDKPNGFHGSFLPPSKCATATDFPASIKQESSISNEKQAQELSSSSLSDESRIIKKGKTCPVCGAAIRSSEYQAHLQLEIQTLSKITRFTRQTRSASRPASSPAEKKKGETRWSTYQKVRANRQRRANAKVQASAEETICPVCNIKIFGTPDELNHHADQCLRKQQRQTSSSPSSEENDISVDTFEEYEWAGQTRIRATSLLDRGFRGFPASKYNGCDDDQQDLNVDGDDSLTYGNAQYSEADVIPCSTNEPEEDKKREALRNALVDGKVPNNRHPILQKWSSTNDEEESSFTKEKERMKEISKEDNTASPKLSNNACDRPICLICMEGYTTPLVSISCWHVHCEECWLRTLGAKKLCPQCNLITSPQDLRRIYL